MKKRTRNRNYLAGFTLYELLLVMAISAILIVMSCLGWRDGWSSMQAQPLRYALRQSVLSASLAARKSGHAVSMCGIADDGQPCSSDWSQGWFTIDGQTQAVLERHELSSQFSLQWAGGLGKPVRFRPDGRPDGVQGGWRCKLHGRELFHEVLLRVV